MSKEKANSIPEVKKTIALGPTIAITNTFVVASKTAMLTLTAQTGDVAVRSDISKLYILEGTNPEVFANWTKLLSPTLQANYK